MMIIENRQIRQAIDAESADVPEIKEAFRDGATPAAHRLARRGTDQSNRHVASNS